MELNVMEMNPNKPTEEKSEETSDAVREGKILPLDLAMQMYPLLEDYFCGTFAKNSKGILMKMENGQIFQLKVEEVA